MKITLSELKQIIKQEIKKVRKLNENIEKVSIDELQNLIDQNQYIRGQQVILDGPNKNILDSNNYLLFFSDYSADHIKERHSDPKKPGSLFKPNLNLKTVALEFLNKIRPTEENNTNVNWIAVNYSSIVGSMGLAVANTEEEFYNLEDYTMPDYKRELVKIKRNGMRKPTNKLTMITAKLGTLSNGKEFLSLVTMFPGGMDVDGVQIPKERSEFNDKLIYFVTENKKY